MGDAGLGGLELFAETPSCWLMKNYRPDFHPGKNNEPQENFAEEKLLKFWLQLNN